MRKEPPPPPPSKICGSGLSLPNKVLSDAHFEYRTHIFFLPVGQVELLMTRWRNRFLYKFFLYLNIVSIRFPSLSCSIHNFHFLVFQAIYLFVGKNVQVDLIQNIFNYNTFQDLPDTMVRLYFQILFQSFWTWNFAEFKSPGSPLSYVLRPEAWESAAHSPNLTSLSYSFSRVSFSSQPNPSLLHPFSCLFFVQALGCK